MSYPFGETVYRDRPPQIPDEYHPGHTTAGEYDEDLAVPISGGFVASSSSTAITSATRGQVLSAKSLFCSPATDVQIGDRIRTASGVWYINELPTADVNPFTGWQPVREVPLDGTLG